MLPNSTVNCVEASIEVQPGSVTLLVHVLQASTSAWVNYITECQLANRVKVSSVHVLDL